VLARQKREFAMSSSRFATIDAEADAARVWVFPITFKPKSNGRTDKVGLVPWKSYQLQQPSDTERAEWRARLF
jgi:hypothetical protein